MPGLPPLTDILEEYQLVDAEDRYRLLIDLGRAARADARGAQDRRDQGARLLGLGLGLSDRERRPAALPRRQQRRDHQGDRRAGPVARFRTSRRRKSPRLDVAEALAPFELSKHLSANRTQGVPNMIALVKQTAERYAAAA